MITCLSGGIATGNYNVEIKDGKIAGITSMKLAGGDVTDCGGKTLLPGLIDLHTHITGLRGAEASDMKTPLKAMAVTCELTGRYLDYGFTAIRDCGSFDRIANYVRDMSVFGHFLRDAIEAGYIEGPHIVPGGQVLSITGGHADENTAFPYEIMKDNPCSYLCDGVDECIKAVRKQFREGAEFIKICATGGVSSSTDGVDDIQFSDEEVRAIVEEAKRHGAYVAAHCMANFIAGENEATTTDMNLCFLRGIELGQHCNIKVITVKAGRSLIRLRAEAVCTETNKMVASGSGSWMPL